jgi:transcription antitermination factor NusG
MSKNEKDHLIQRIKEIQEEQTNLHREQQDLIAQLEQLSLENDQNTEESDNENEIQLGDKVRILTPGKFKETEGTICKIGPSRVTILTKKKNKIVRKPSNVKKI